MQQHYSCLHANNNRCFSFQLHLALEQKRCLTEARQVQVLFSGALSNWWGACSLQQ